MSKLHPHLKKHIKDVIASEIQLGKSSPRWKEELLKTIEEELLDSIPAKISTEVDLEKAIDTVMFTIRKGIMEDLESIEVIAKQIPLDLLRRYNH